MLFAVSCDEIITETWEAVYPVNTDNIPEFVCETSDGNILSGGGIRSNSDYSPSVCAIVMTDSHGTMLWTKTFDQVRNIYANSPIMAREVSNGCLVAYLDYDNLSVNLTLLDMNGEHIDAWSFPTSFVRVRAFQLTEESILISGWTVCDRYDANNPSQCIMYSNQSTALFSLNGDMLWACDDASNVITATRDGGAAIVTEFSDSDNDTVHYGVVNKINASGEREWATTVKTGALIFSDYCTPKFIRENETGGFVYAAYYGPVYEMRLGTMVSTLASTGRVVRSVYSNDQFIKGLRENPGGGYIITGYVSTTYSLVDDLVIDGIYVRKLTSGLSVDWNQEFIATGTDPWKMSYDACETQDGGYVVSGSKTTANYWLMKTDSLGRIDVAAEP
ncbi:MAG: hypothetical protein KKD44_23655 [Proteobacteria bacterium]|nr:hypothetical protein [Pseudomonadota bacterium]